MRYWGSTTRLIARRQNTIYHSKISTGLDFLESGSFAREIQIYGYWIRLDFLGFSRPNLDLSTGYAEFSREQFFRALLPWRAAGTRNTAVEIMRVRRIIHPASLNLISVFRQSIVAR
jgi:hypothetical protein